MKRTILSLLVATISVATMCAQNPKKELYSINGKHAENLDGSQLKGKTTTSYVISDSVARKEDLVYVVDGKIVPYSRIKDISPSNIASVTIIKNQNDPYYIKYSLEAQKKGMPKPKSIVVVEEARVDIGYGTEKKDRITSAVSQVEMNDKEVGGYSNMFDYLRGKVPGVNVVGSGRSAQIQIRGINSLNCSTDPLILVDGVEINDLNMINPNDVKSVSVLKDASASIYGSKGANGVILITMKR